MTQPDKGPVRPRHNVKIVRKNNRMEIPSSLDYLPKVDQFVESKLKKLRIKKDQLVDIAISVSEIVTNAVMHGNKNDLGKKVKINVEASPSQVEVIVEDEGTGFDPSSVECRLDPESLLKEAGRGILIVDSLMDKVEILCGPGKGTKVKIVKLLR
ncbi:MAG: ATP-binding protein [Candidatus Zixiibacteriota bacterium]|nr:MAG: ATP-binding protein [candidate division Zixibacteria bacterium]